MSTEATYAVAFALAFWLAIGCWPSHKFPASGPVLRL